ncbi:DUF1491 family protein [Maricaulis sp.]|uniref:DUF1491 family protein n=1 Tax=Maricaulis sp. TaxID=1486257 RepID=UPI001B142D37|nr:DUF1491 family protein [Maricaulis sp.]MBO6765274.1 DUF1491 family protein [Maricaulis sp.]
MSELKTKFWVDALVRRADTGLASAYVIRRGDEDAGAVLVKVVLARDLAQLYVPARDGEGKRVWTLFGPVPAGEADIDAYCRRRIDNDPDIWLVEIEDRDGRHFLTEPVETAQR